MLYLVVRGLRFEGNVYLNGEVIGSVEIIHNKYGFGDDENMCSIGVDDEDFDEDVLEAIQDACYEAFDSVMDCGLYSFVYRE